MNLRRSLPIRALLLLSCLALFLPSQLLLRAAEFNQRLVNLSSRGPVGTGDNVMVAGFVVSEGAKKPVLVRAVGPGLSAYGVTGVLANPTLRLFNSSGLEIATNDDWSSDAEKAAALTSAFTATGAFKLTSGSRDAVLLATLEAGAYTAQVAGFGDTSGTALLEIYDVSGAARLLNLSTRARLDSGSPLVFSGLIVAQGQARRVLVRAVGPTLAGFGLTQTLSDPVLEVRNDKGVTLFSNNDWSSGGASATATLVSELARVGAFALGTGSKDAALIIDTLQAGNYSVVVSGNAGASGVALVEIYDLTPESLSTVSVNATVASTDSVGADPAEFTFTRSGNLAQPLSVAFTLGGTAVMGTDYEPLPQSVTFRANESSVVLRVIAKGSNSSALGYRSVTLTLSPSQNYGLGAKTTDTVALFYNPGTLFVANLRPVSGATGGSVASGTATIQLSPDESFAILTVTFSNLSSAQVTAHLAVGAPGQDGPFVFTVPSGQVAGTRWDFRASGIYTTADLVKALKEGRIYISIDSANFPNGELRGQYILSSGSFNFAEPAAPPALADTPLTAADASRFLVQATFGPTKAEIDALTGKKLADLGKWIDAQRDVTASLHRTATMEDFNAYGGSGTPATPNSTNRQNAWWRHALTAPDQLRQRVAFALSEIFVISDQNSILVSYQEGMAHYYDHMVRNALGNYRQLLEDVTLSPMMGIYLSHLRNRKATSATGAQPDENYAREIMQLFSIGLNQLQPDGTLKLSPAGQVINTYDNTTITQMARIFTGWSYYTETPATTSFTGGRADYINPMTLFSAYHDDGAKTIVAGKAIPANQGGLKDLKETLDTLFTHTNTAPFVSRQLIQRLVTSNPSPGYVYRVAKVFENNGAGVRGDLHAVVKAILLDYEARSPVVAAAVGFGKMKEPILRTTHLLRAFDAKNTNNRYLISSLGSLAQAPLQAQTVFNFFEPAYVLPGALAAAGLYAPEYQILTDTTAITIPNYLYSFITATRSATTIAPDFTALLTLARQPGPLVDQLNVLFCSGSMPTAVRDRLVAALNAVPSSTSDLDRVRTAVYLTTSTQQAAIQK